MTIEVYGQILGIIATAIIAVSFQCNKRIILLIIQAIGVLLLSISYFMLGAWSGGALNAVCCVRDIFFLFQAPNSTANRITTAISIVVMGIMGALSWQSYISLLIISALILNSFFISLGKPQVLRYSCFLTCVMVLIYNIVVFSIGGILNELVVLTSSAIGTMRYLKGKKKATE